MTSYRDNEELLHHVLKTLANEQYKFQLYNNPQFRKRQEESQDTAADLDFTNQVTFDAEEFEIRARELGVDDVSPFYKSDLFVKYGYRVDTRADAQGRESRVIVKTIGATTSV